MYAGVGRREGKIFDKVGEAAKGAGGNVFGGLKGARGGVNIRLEVGGFAWRAG